MTSTLNEEELVEEIGKRRTHVLQKYADFKQSAIKKKHGLVQACQLQNFNRNAEEIRQNIDELIDAAEKILVKTGMEHLERASKQLKRLKNDGQALEGNLKGLEAAANRLINEEHYAKDVISQTSEKVRDRWRYLMELVDKKLESVQCAENSNEFCAKCDVLLEWINKVKNREWTSETNRVLFNEIRKKMGLWNEIGTIFEAMSDPSANDIEYYEKVKQEWVDFQKFVDSLMRELDENERVSEILHNSKEIQEWIEEKEYEVNEKYSNMDVEESMKYRKTIEIELKTTAQRIDELKKNAVGNPNLKDEIEKTERRFMSFLTFIQKWMQELKDKTEIEALMKEADDILYFCAEKVEDLNEMKKSESTDSDEIAVWIESNCFDFNSWDNVFDIFIKNAQSLLEKNIEIDKVRDRLDDVRKAYESTKQLAKSTNDSLDETIQSLLIEDQIGQIHTKAAQLVALLKGDWNGSTSEEIEKLIRMNDGLSLRCSSVVEQIDVIYKDTDTKILNSRAARLLDDLIDMQKILDTTCEERKEALQQKLDVLYLLDGCQELNEHTRSINHNLRTEIHREARLKSSKGAIVPMKEQLEKLVNDFEFLKPVLGEMEEAIRKEMKEIRRNIEDMEEEHDAQLSEYDVKRYLDNTASFVERVERWIVDSKVDDDEVDSPIQDHNLRRIINNCRHILSTSDNYQKAIEKHREEATKLGTHSDEAMCILDGAENSLEEFNSTIYKIIQRTEEKLNDSEKMNDLTSHNDWIKGKIKRMMEEPSYDSLLTAQKMNTRYEKESEEIENRRKNINDVIADVKENGHKSCDKLMEEIEKNWSKMKMMFDEKGGEVERMVKLFEYDEESANVWEWIREKMMNCDAIEPKDDEELNRMMAKKLTVMKTDVENFKPNVIEAHALLEDALITPKNSTVTQTTHRFKNDLTKKQGEIENEYKALKRMIDSKLGQLGHLIQENEVVREIQETEKWIEMEEIQLNRLVSSHEKQPKETDTEISSRLEDAETNLNRRRTNLAEIKCQRVRDGASPSIIQKIDDTFSMLNVFAFELDRIRQKVNRSKLLKTLEVEIDDVIDSMKTAKKKGRSVDVDLESWKRRVWNCLEKAKEVRSENADLAPRVYELEEILENEWNDLIAEVERRKKKEDEEKLRSRLENELLELEHWIDTFGEEVVMVTSNIHDGLGVQVALEAIDGWKEEWGRKSDEVGGARSYLVEISEENGKEQLKERLEDVEREMEKAGRMIEMKNEELLDLMEILHAERNCDRLTSWIISKRRSLTDDISTNGQDAKTVIRRMGEIEKMMMNRENELDELKEFVDQLETKPNTYERHELEGKFENLMDEWRQLEEDLKKREVDFNESMSQLYYEEEYEKIQQWIEKKIESLKDVDATKIDKKVDVEKKKKEFDTIYAEIQEFLPIYEDFLRNENAEEEKVTVISTMWTRLVETTVIKQKCMKGEIEKNRLFETLENMHVWLSDAESDAHSAVNMANFYNTADADKSSRKLAGLHEHAIDKEHIVRNIRPIGNEKEQQRMRQMADQLINGIVELKSLIKTNREDLEIWKDMQDVVKAIDEEICWFKELSVIVSSSDVGHDSATLDVIRRKHQRMYMELERRKLKVVKTIDRATEVLSIRSRPALYPKFDEIGEKVAQMEELIESIGQIADIRTHRLDKWKTFFDLMDELKEKEQVLEQIREISKANGEPEKMLSEIERKAEIVKTIGEQMEKMKELAEKMTNDEIIRTKAAEHTVEKVKMLWETVGRELENKAMMVNEGIENSKFLWKCDLAIQSVGDQEQKIGNLVRQKRPCTIYENAQYHSTMSFVEEYSRGTVQRLIDTSETMKTSGMKGERDKKLSVLKEKLDNLNKELDKLADKIISDVNRKERIQKLQDEYARRAGELANWLEQANEDVADVVDFQTKRSSDECLEKLMKIMDVLRNEKVGVLEELELIEVELAEYGEDVKIFTWHTYQSLANGVQKLVNTIQDRIRIVETEINRHSENEKICIQGADVLEKCRNVLISTKKEVERVSNLSLDEQKSKLIELISKLEKSGMLEDLEHLRSLMDSRYIFDNKHSKYTPNGVLNEICQCLELMASMLRSVEQSMADRSNSGVSEKQLQEFEHSFDYFDRERHGWLDYEKFELCIKSQGYDFAIEQQNDETMSHLDPDRSGRILKTDYMEWMIKNETTNVYDNRAAIEEALKTIDAKKLSDSMSRKEAEFFMNKIGRHTETYTTEHIHLEYNDFVKSFY